MDKKQLTIIIPVYNSETYLEKCISSVIQQTYNDFRLILVDDASTDHSGDICDAFAKLDERVTVIHHLKNKGLSLSREDGFQLTDSEWISFIDSDDYIAPYMYEELMKQAVGTSNIDIVCVRGEDKTSNEIEHMKWCKQECGTFSLLGEEACNQIYGRELDFGCVEPIWGKVIRRKLIEDTQKEVEPYKEQLYWVYFEDVLFMPMLFYYAKKIIFRNEMMYMHRRSENNLSSTLEPKEYHYQAASASFVVLDFFHKVQLKKAFAYHLIGSFMGLQSTWYKVWNNEKNDRKKQDFDRTVDVLLKKYKNDINRVKLPGVGNKINKLNILIFRYNRYIWGATFGNLYFKYLRKKLYG